ncbi:MAG: translation initiation factor IF-2, partial [Phycisphaerae bacterium]|nr:translation initiation factor IF-2 [Phycisphaerae bacterium]
AGVSPRRTKAKSRREEAEAEAARARANPRRHGGSVSEVDARLREWRDQDLIERKERLASVTGHGLRDRRAAERRRQAQPAHPQAISGRKEAITLTVPITVKDFCGAVGSPFATVSKKLMEQTGRLWMINQTLDGELAELIALELGVGVRVQKARTAYERLQDEFASRERKHLRRRPPVVAMLGHVDHGKTSLLDALRSANVAAGEAGGITQHIGAYRVSKGNWNVTFVDTPGHEAFTAMRARGANLTDVVVLVVAADDGVMPQTVEAINHARAAKVPIVVALNKIDLPGVDVNKIYGQLSEHQLTPQAWGGDTDVIHTSATTGEGIDELLVHLAAMSDLMDLRADTRVPAFGTVIEARMKEGAGAVARVMVREGRLREGAVVVCGPSYGKVRAMTDEVGKRQKSAGPATPVELAGLSAIPAAGDELYEVDTLQEAKAAAEEIQRQRREAELAQLGKPTDLTSLLASATGEEVPSLNVILKADVQGSVDVLRKTLEDIPRDQVRLNILHSGVGAISDGDVMLAAASKAIVIGFTVIAEPSAQKLAQEHGVELRFYRVIYEVDDDIRKALAGLLAPAESIESRGRAEVRQVFNVGKVGRIAGCFVRDGTVARNHMVRVVRDSVVIKERSALASLRRFKDDVREVRAGLECGMRLDGFDDLKPGDVIESYEVVQVERTL